MAQKTIQLVSGDLTEVEANVTSAGAGDSGKLVALGAGGKLDNTVMPDGIGTDGVTREASETVSAGEIANLWLDTTAKVRKADASGGVAKKAVGFFPAGITAAASGEIRFDGTITGLSGLTIGATYYLSATAGAITTTPPTTSGHIVQKVGVAISATELSFEPGEPVVLA